MTVAEKVSAAFKEIVRKRVAAGNHTQWGNADSVAVVVALVELMVNDDEVQLEGTDAIEGQIGLVVNPSAFAQRLEEFPDGTGLRANGDKDLDAEGKPVAAHPSYIRRPKKGTSRGVKLDV